MNRLLRTKPLIIFFLLLVIPFFVILINETIGKLLLYGFYFTWIALLSFNFSETKKEKWLLILYFSLILSIWITTPMIFNFNNSIYYEPNYEKITTITFGLFIIHLFVAVIAYYKTILLITRKILKINSTYDNLSIYLFSFLIYPIGIWIIQNDISNALVVKLNLKSNN